MPKDIKLFTLAKKLNVGIGSFKDSLEKKNVLDVNTITPNTRVPREVAEQLIAEHGKGMGKAEIAALLDTLSGAAAKPAPAKPAAKPEAPVAEPAPCEGEAHRDGRPRGSPPQPQYQGLHRHGEEG